MEEAIMFTDGASRGNPGEAGYGIVIMDKERNTIKEICGYLGITTNNIAEYSALREGLKVLKEMGVSRVSVFTDSELMVKQLKGEYKVRNLGLLPYYNCIQEIVKSFESFEINHIPRSQNKRADILANQGIDCR